MAERKGLYRSAAITMSYRLATVTASDWVSTPPRPLVSNNQSCTSGVDVIIASEAGIAVMLASRQIIAGSTNRTERGTGETSYGSRGEGIGLSPARTLTPECSGAVRP